MASQYAGWAVTPEGYFAMGSGPLRARARVERELFEKLGYAEDAVRGVLVLETRTLPTAEVAAWVAGKAGLRPDALTFAVAPTASLAGGVQIVARMVETGLHKMDTLGFDVRRVVSAMGTAPLPPTAKNDLRAIGRTNDCVLYGGQSRYVVRAEDTELEELAGKHAVLGLERLRHALLRDLQALRQRLLSHRPAALQPGRGLADQRDQRPHLPCRPAQSGRAARVPLQLMHVVVLSARTGWHTDELCRALAARGHVGVVLPYEALLARMGRTGGSPEALTAQGVSLFDADAVLARIIPSGTLEQIIYRVDALHWIEDRGVPVMNSPRAIERTVDKFYTSALLREAGLPTPETVVCERAADALAAVEAFGDAVIKPIFGSMGLGLVRVSDVEVARRVIKPLEQARAVFYVQRWVEHGGRDLRAFVVGGRVIGGDRTPGGGRGVAHQRLAGWPRRPVTLPDEWSAHAVRAAAVVGADYAGVDLLPSVDGRVFVLEVNGIPGWEGLQRATGIDVSSALVEHLESRVGLTNPARPVGGQAPRA